MKKIFAVALGILTAIGGFVDIGDLNTTAVEPAMARDSRPPSGKPMNTFALMGGLA